MLRHNEPNGRAFTPAAIDISAGMSSQNRANARGILLAPRTLSRKLSATSRGPTLGVFLRNIAFRGEGIFVPEGNLNLGRED